GTATYYNVGMGSCGEESSDDEFVVALSPAIMNHDLCGETIQVETDDGSVSARVVDTCPACDADSIDLSPAAFDEIGDRARGRVDITWSF
ncbi:RlpA-like double-psi beta-barrel-protein domain-containing protein-containing protein, partial [Chlamydoabsidia padenii]